MKIFIKNIVKKTYKLFTRHPQEVGESYFAHLMWALVYSLHFFYAGIGCFVHAFFPFLFEGTGSSIAAWIVESTDDRGGAL